MRITHKRERVRKRLVVRDASACYHVMSRTSCGQHLFGDKEKEQFRVFLRKQAEFCGLEILSYSVMSNHFHILVRVPHEGEISDRELMRRYRVLYSDERVPLSSLKPSDLSKILKNGGDEAEEERERLRLRMGDLSAFMRELKQRFGTWYNRTHKNMGTIWSNRFKSLLVEDCANALSVVSAYIDLNAVRAELVSDPAEYRYCSYSEAMSGNQKARKGLMSIYESVTWRNTIASYRLLLFGKGNKVKGVSGKDKGVINADRVREVILADGEVSMAEALQCRVRYFSDGMVFGSERFVEKIFEDERFRFGEKRKRGGHNLRGILSEDLKVMRDLSVNVIG